MTSQTTAGARTADNFRNSIARAICRPRQNTDRVVTLSDQLDAVMELVDQRQKALTDFAQSIIDADSEGHMMPSWLAKEARDALAEATGGVSND